jgi:hypothetical protein
MISADSKLCQAEKPMTNQCFVSYNLPGVGVERISSKEDLKIIAIILAALAIYLVVGGVYQLAKQIWFPAFPPQLDIFYFVLSRFFGSIGAAALSGIAFVVISCLMAIAALFLWFD